MFVQFLNTVWFALFIRQCLLIVHVVTLSSSLVSLFSPHGVLNIVTVEGDEEAKDGEEHDGVGSQHQPTRASGDLEQMVNVTKIFKRLK